VHPGQFTGENTAEELAFSCGLYALNLIPEERVDVSLPTSDEMAGFAELMRFRSLESLLRQRAPEYAERIERPDTSPLHLKIRLDDGTGVLLGWLSKLPGG
jgi:hypothetical protein